MSRIDEIEARLKAATPGPWKAKRRWVSSAVLNSRRAGNGNIISDLEPRYASFVTPLDLQVYGRGWRFGEHDLPGSEFVAPDADFIAHAPDDLRALLDVAKAVEAIRQTDIATGCKSSGFYRAVDEAYSALLALDPDRD